MSKQYRLDDPELPPDMRRMVHRLARSRIQAPTPDLALLQQALKAQTYDDWRAMLGDAQREPTTKAQEPTGDSDHFAHGPDMRKMIASDYRKSRGRIRNRGAWARANYNISARTLARYLEEFPEDD